LLLIPASSFNFFILKDLKKLCFLSHMLLYVQVPHMLLTLKPYFKM
jgi:hypothetical protein